MLMSKRKTATARITVFTPIMQVISRNLNHQMITKIQAKNGNDHQGSSLI
jgi:hypothetical protein